MRMRVMQVLIKETGKDENKSVHKESIWEKACKLYSPVSEYTSSNTILKDRVFQELLHLGDIQSSQTDKEIRITRRGADKPKYQISDNL